MKRQEKRIAPCRQIQDFSEAGAPLPAPGAFLVDIAGEDRVGLLPLGRGEAAASRSPAPPAGRASARRTARASGRGRNRSARSRRALWSSGRAARRSCGRSRPERDEVEPLQQRRRRRPQGNTGSRNRASSRRRPCRSGAARRRASRPRRRRRGAPRRPPPCPIPSSARGADRNPPRPRRAGRTSATSRSSDARRSAACDSASRSPGSCASGWRRRPDARPAGRALDRRPAVDCGRASGAIVPFHAPAALSGIGKAERRARGPRPCTGTPSSIERDIDGELAVAADELLRAVERIDEQESCGRSPARLSAATASSATIGMSGIAAASRFGDRVLGADVGFADRRIVGLVRRRRNRSRRPP